MAMLKLDHINVRTTNLAAMESWYTNVLGMTVGRRPDFDFPGAWMYIGDHAVVHLVGVEGSASAGAGSETDLKLEHFALSAKGWKEFEARLTAMGEKYRTRKLPGFNILQCNVWDPDGNHIHVDFPSDEVD